MLKTVVVFEKARSSKLGDLLVINLANQQPLIFRVMEVLQLTTRRPKDLGSSPRHPGEPGWLPPSHSSLPQSSSSSECGALGGRPPSPSALLQLSGNSSSVDLVNAYFHGAPPPPAPAR